jgi:glycosyltransferase involved in cell wall biosynthesis
MKILYFSRDYTTHDHRFLASLAGAGHQMYFLRLEKRGADLEDRPLPPDVVAIHWAGGRSPFRFSRLPRLLASLHSVLRKIQPDLVHAGPIQTAGLLTALTGYHPFVVVSWGSDLLRDADRNGFWRWATRYTLSRGDVLVGDCNPVREKAIALGMDPARIVTFPWGVDIHRFSPPNSETAGIPQDPLEAAPEPAELRARLGWENSFVLLSTRAWEPGYGVDELARAFVRAAQARPELRLLLLGAGKLAPLLRRIFLQGNVLERVHFGGQVSQRELPRYFRAANMYISASHSDGTSISLLEALATGLPALVSDIPGNREWITPGKQGWTFPVGDVAGLASAMENAAIAPNLATLSRAARELAEARADWRLNFQELLRAYSMAVHQNGHSVKTSTNRK